MLIVDMRNPKSHILLVFLLFAVGNATYAQSYQPFIDSLNAMAARDQAIRRAPWSEENSQKMAVIDSTKSFNEIKAMLDSKPHPRYSIDAWNNSIPFIIRNHAGHVGESDYLEFFDWLFGQVVIGNYHLFDYAELYDEVYCRLFGKSYYGQKTFDKEVPLFEEEKVDERRKEIQLPSIEVWEKIRNKACPVNITF